MDPKEDFQAFSDGVHRCFRLVCIGLIRELRYAPDNGMAKLSSETRGLVQVMKAFEDHINPGKTDAVAYSLLKTDFFGTLYSAQEAFEKLPWKEEVGDDYGGRPFAEATRELLKCVRVREGNSAYPEKSVSLDAEAFYNLLANHTIGEMVKRLSGMSGVRIVGSPEDLIP